MLGGISPDQIRRIVPEARSAGRSPLPAVGDAALRECAMRIGEAQGLKGRLARELTPTFRRWPSPGTGPRQENRRRQAVPGRMSLRARLSSDRWDFSSPCRRFGPTTQTDHA